MKFFWDVGFAISVSFNEVKQHKVFNPRRIIKFNEKSLYTNIILAQAKVSGLATIIPVPK